MQGVCQALKSGPRLVSVWTRGHQGTEAISTGVRGLSYDFLYIYYALFIKADLRSLHCFACHFVRTLLLGSIRHHSAGLGLRELL